jgi:multiple sugar transport system permease protein
MLIAVFGQVMSCSLVGYGLARVQFKGNGLLFALVIFSMVVPPQCIIVPQYLMYAKVNLLDTFVPIILPCYLGLGLNGGLFIFLFRQYYRGVPKELENAALIDGTGLFGAYFKIVFPTASPTILVASILSLIWQWNNSFEPSVYIKSDNIKTLPMLLKNFSGAINYGSVGSVNGIKLAATFLCVLPLIILFFILQKRLMKGIESSGLAN